MYAYDLDVIRKLTAEIEEAEKASTGCKKVSGKVAKATFNAVVDNRFAHRSSEAKETLKDELHRTNPGSHVDYKALFKQTVDGEQTLYVSILRDQTQEDRTLYLSEFKVLYEHLVEANLPEDQKGDHGKQMITKEIAVSVFKELDPKKSKEEVMKYVNRGFGENSSWEWSKAGVRNLGRHISDFITSFGRGMLQRSGPRSEMLHDLVKIGSHITRSGNVTPIQ